MLLCSVYVSPEGLMLLALHVQHHINNVLQHLGASNVPGLGHMTHQEDGDVVLLRNMQQCCGTLPDLQHRYLGLCLSLSMHPCEAWTQTSLLALLHTRPVQVRPGQ